MERRITVESILHTGGEYGLPVSGPVGDGWKVANMAWAGSPLSGDSYIGNLVILWERERPL